jgi:hypothetical protein
MAAPDQSDTAPPSSPTDPTGPSTGPPGVPPPPPVLPPTEEPVAEPTPRAEATDPAPPPVAEDPLGPPPGPATSATEVPAGTDGPAAVEDPLGPPADPAPPADQALAPEKATVPATNDAILVPLADGTAGPAAPDLATQPDGQKSRLDVNGTQLCASTLASVSAAVVSSVFGVTGTVIGAAVGSVLATTGTAFYSHGLRQTTAKLQQTPVVRLSRWSRIWAGGRTTETSSTSTSTTTARSAAPGSGKAASGPGADDSDRPAWKDWLADRRWGLVIGVVIVFVASMAAITAVELVGRGPLASATGNDPSGQTSIGSLLDADSNSDEDDGLDPTEGEQAPGDTETTLAPDDPAADDGTTDDGTSDTPTTSVDGTDPGDDPTVTEPATDPGTDPGTGTDTGAAETGAAAPADSGAAATATG